MLSFNHMCLSVALFLSRSLSFRWGWSCLLHLENKWHVAWSPTWFVFYWHAFVFLPKLLIDAHQIFNRRFTVTSNPVSKQFVKHWCHFVYRNWPQWLELTFWLLYFCLKTLILTWKIHFHVYGRLHFITIARTDFNVQPNSHSLHTLTRVNPTD